MRNLKKALALVLALMMTLSLMVTASAAGYGDKDKIDSDKSLAVDIMSGLGVLQGAGGEFRPEGNLRRSEAAKIIAYLNLGKDAAEYLPREDAVCADVPANQWYTGYVLWCDDQGIIAIGDDGKFNPNNYVTGIQFAKMLLTSLGYDQWKQGYAGTSNWENKIKLDAASAKLITGVSISNKTYLTRQEAAQMAANLLNAPCVEYKDNSNTPSKTGETFLSNSTVYNMAHGDKNGVVNTITAANGDTPASFKVGAQTVVGEIDESLLGHYIDLYYSMDDTTVNYVAAVDLSTIVTVDTRITTSAGLTEKFGAGVTKAASGTFDIIDGKNGANGLEDTTLKFTSTEVAEPGAYTVYNNEVVARVGITATAVRVSSVSDYTKNDTTHSITLAGIGANGTDTTAASIDLKGTPSSSLAKVNLYDGIAKDDLVLVTRTKEGDTWVLTLAKLDKAVSNVEFTSVKGTNYTLGGETYEKSSAAVLGSVLNDVSATLVAGALGNKYDVYLDADGKICGVKPYEADVTGVAVLQEIVVNKKGTVVDGNAIAESEAYVRLVVLTGDEQGSKTYNIPLTAEQKANDTDLNAAAVASTDGSKALKLGSGLTTGSVREFVQYVLNDAGQIVELRRVAPDHESGNSGEALVANSVTVTNLAGKYLTADTVLVYYEDATMSNTTIVTGFANVKSFTEAAQKDLVYIYDGNNVKYVLVNKAVTVETAKPVGFMVSDDVAEIRRVNGVNLYDYTVYVDGEVKTLTAKSDLSLSIADKSLVNWTVDGDGYVDAITAAATTADTKETVVDADITYANSGMILAGGKQYNAANAKAYTVAADGKITATDVAISDNTKHNTLLYLPFEFVDSTNMVVSYIYYVET